MRVKELIPAPGWSAVVAFRNQPINSKTLNDEGVVTFDYVVHPLIGWGVDDRSRVVPVIYSERLAAIYESDGLVNPLELQHDIFIGFSATVLEPGQVLTDKLKDSLRTDIEEKRRERGLPVLAEEAALVAVAEKTSGQNAWLA